MCRGGQGLPPFPAPLSPLAELDLRFAPDRFLLTKANTSYTIEMPASLRTDGVRDHRGMPFGFIRDLAFGFAGISSAVVTNWNSPTSLTSTERQTTGVIRHAWVLAFLGPF